LSPLRLKSFMEVCPGCSWISHEKATIPSRLSRQRRLFWWGTPISRQFRSQHPKPQWRYGERLAAGRS